MALWRKGMVRPTNYVRKRCLWRIFDVWIQITAGQPTQHNTKTLIHIRTWIRRNANDFKHITIESGGKETHNMRVHRNKRETIIWITISQKHIRTSTHTIQNTHTPMYARMHAYASPQTNTNLT